MTAPRDPRPPYYAVIFSSRLGADRRGYAEAATRMEALARQQSGFLGLESARDAVGFGITVSYWDSAQAIAAWKQQAEHRATQELGRSRWYESYRLRVCRVEREYAAGEHE